jgi:hypothetical protein
MKRPDVVAKRLATIKSRRLAKQNITLDSFFR